MEKAASFDAAALLKMLVFSSIGIVMFFVPIEIAGRSTILFDHAASYLVREWKTPVAVIAVLMMIYGAVAPIANGNWNKSFTERVLTLFKIAGVLITLWYLSGTAPAVLTEKDMLPFLYEKLSLPLSMIIPIGALALAFLIGFGLLEMVGVLMQPVMRRLWKTPGSSAIDAVASFVGSYSVGLLLTDQVYRAGKYTAREAAIIATGFSTVSAAFMVVVAKTLDLMPFWNFYFWSCFVITFAITAVTARLPPITRIDHSGGVADHSLPWSKRLPFAFASGLAVAQNADQPLRILWSHFWAGVKMAAAILPSIMAIGLTGLLLAKYTPVFDALGLLLVPFTWLGGLSEPFAAAKGMASGLAEMFLPAILLKEADILTRYVTAVISVSSVIFFSALIPCVLATSIPLSIRHMLLVWLQRTAIGILMAAAVGRLGLAMGWLA
ncbi:MAG: YjiH family protein [Neisseria sp.]|uniref:YjiH family protein n=1 Tax=Neisseria sp. TaxID=192066 RepID=UPI0026DD5393|nr:YjiH family protein [Neisseria sp.]MDO4247876.1 YjiH family protein [Neisseria sp.]